LTREPEFADYLSCTIDPLRESGASHTMVLLSLLDLVSAVADRTREPERRALLAQHVDALLVAGERSLSHPRDRRTFNEHAEGLRRALTTRSTVG
jgi:uncharacterized membrane protein